MLGTPGGDASQNVKAEGYSHNQAQDAGIQSTGETVKKKKDITAPEDAPGPRGN